MRIVCPSCNAAYQVPDDVVARGAVLRCARCAHGWTPAAAPSREPAQAAAAPPENLPSPGLDPGPNPGPDPAPPDARPVPSVWADTPPEPEARAGGTLRLAWLASLLVLAGAAGAAVLWREALVAAWPPLARLFMALGLAG